MAMTLEEKPRRKQLSVKVSKAMADEIAREAKRRDVPEAQVMREWLTRGRDRTKGAEASVFPKQNAAI